MPEPYWPKRKGSYTLSDAHRNRGLVRIECRYCKLERFYIADDLRKVIGDIECDDVTFQMRCAKCKKKETLVLSIEHPAADKRQQMTIRRLETIYYVRRVIWRDETG